MPQSSSDIRTAYDLAANAYADSFLDELSRKPRDIEHLRQFASSVGSGQRVLDLGCGPGHTTAHLASLRLKPVGVDLSPEMIGKAKALFSELEFIAGDFFQLPDRDDSVAGLLAFYCIVHLQAEQLEAAFSEMFRVLKPDGILLLSFHIGCDMVVQENFLDTGAMLEFFPFPVVTVPDALLAAGFTDLEILERPPYDTEYPTDRCYVFAHKRHAT